MVRVAILALALVACSGGPPKADSASAKAVGDTLVLSVSLDPDNANPLVAPYALSGWVIDGTSPGLVRRMISDAGLTYEPALAKSWRWNDAGTELTYTLRDDIRFEDGVPLTSADVVFTFGLIDNKDVASNWKSATDNMRRTADGALDIGTPDPHTVVFHFNEPRSPVLQQGDTIYGILPKHAFEGVAPSALRTDEASKQPLATGPWRIVTWKHNDHLILEPNPMAPAEWRPKLARIIYRVTPETSTRILQMTKGDIDMLPSVGPKDVEALRALDRVDVRQTDASSLAYIGYNLSDQRFADKRVRQALTLAIDRQGLVDKLFNVGGVPSAQAAIGTVSPSLGPWFASEVKPLPFDPVMARTLLAEAGWVDSDGDGFVDRDGKALGFSLMMQKGTQEGKDIATVIIAQWSDVGVQAELMQLDGITFDDRARRREYEAMLWGFGANAKVDPTQIWSTGGAYNWFGYSNEQVDARILEGVRSVDVAASQQAFRDVQRMVYDDQPVTFLLWVDGFMAIDNRFENTEWSPHNPLFHSERWSVEPSRVKR